MVNDAVTDNTKIPYLDFFAGSGLVCEGLKNFFTTVWANDICAKKAAVFCANHARDIFKLGSIEEVRGHDLPEAVLSWGSFPCQDLSLAGNMAGISSSRSGLVWQWLRVMDEMKRRPPLVVAENVTGLVSVNNGDHYRALHLALVERGYRVGAVVLDAANWTPQSRKRVFVVGVDERIATQNLDTDSPTWCHSASLQRAADGLSNWVWWSMPKPQQRVSNFEEIVEWDAPCDNAEKTNRLLELVPANHRAMLEAALEKGRCAVPGYKRTRNGKQVLELRFDGLAGCLRTPEGGSSRQFLVIRKNVVVNTRLLTVREAAALMGLRKSYKIPGSYNDGYRAMGDAVAVPVSRYLARHLLAPLANRILDGAVMPSRDVRLVSFK